MYFRSTNASVMQLMQSLNICTDTQKILFQSYVPSKMLFHADLNLILIFFSAGKLHKISR